MLNFIASHPSKVKEGDCGLQITDYLPPNQWMDRLVKQTHIPPPTIVDKRYQQVSYTSVSIGQYVYIRHRTDSSLPVNLTPLSYH